MRAVVQRVTSASVAIAGEQTASIGKGLMVLLGVETGDTPKDAAYIAEKLLHLRIFEDGQGVSNLSLLDTGGSLLLVSQFTLAGDARHGRRPSYINAARPEEAVPLYEQVKALLAQQVPLQCGTFRADMQVSLVNDGPFTILLSSSKEF